MVHARHVATRIISSRLNLTRCVTNDEDTDGKGKNRGGRLVLHIYMGTQHCLIKKCPAISQGLQLIRRFSLSTTSPPPCKALKNDPIVKNAIYPCTSPAPPLIILLEIIVQFRDHFPSTYFRIMKLEQCEIIFAVIRILRLDFAYQCAIITDNSNKNFEVNSMNIFQC